MQEAKESFVVTKENWSLHRKAFQDQKRHMDKVKEAIKNNLPDLISEENIIMSDGRDIIKIPIRSLDEYKIRYNYNKSKHVGQGDGESAIGDVVGSDPNDSGQGRQGSGHEAGEEPGVDYYEAEVPLAELEEILFRELELPNLEKKEADNVVTEHNEFNDIRKKGLMGNIDKKRTILEALKRNATAGKPSIIPIQDDDLRFKTWNETVKPESNAVVLAMMDTSASMGDFAKYLARSFFFWMTKFLRTKYETVDIVYIAHHTEAKAVTEEEFFSRGESGGTICSSAYYKALELIDEKYSPARFNIYPFHFSDGENLMTDNPRCMKLIHEMMDMSQMFGYGEVNMYNRHSTLMRNYKDIDDPKFRYYILREKSDVYHTMKKFFQKEAAPV